MGRGLCVGEDGEEGRGVQLESGQRKLPYMASKRSETRNCLKPVTLYTAEGEMQWVGIGSAVSRLLLGKFLADLAPSRLSCPDSTVSPLPQVTAPAF